MKRSLYSAVTFGYDEPAFIQMDRDVYELFKSDWERELTGAFRGKRMKKIVPAAIRRQIEQRKSLIDRLRDDIKGYEKRIKEIEEEIEEWKDVLERLKR